MSMELVTGYSGTGSDGQPNRHVSSMDDALLYASMIGSGRYGLPYLGKLSANLEDANTLVMATGGICMDGHHITCPDTTSFTIPTGVQGMQVSNLACVQYAKSDDGVESVTPIVLTGTPSASDPQDPEYTPGNILAGDSSAIMPLFRVVTNGVNAGEPVQLFSVAYPILCFDGVLYWDDFETENE